MIIYGTCRYLRLAVKKNVRNVSLTLERIAITQWFSTLSILHQAPVWALVAELENQFLFGHHKVHVKMQI